jgi:thiol-disulfide isomerase/thioredoxin
MKVLKFGAIWCPGCVVMKPRWGEIEKENPWLETQFFDADESPDEMEKWEVKDIPEFIFLDKEGKEIERMKGEIEKGVLVAKINELKDE